MTTNQTKYHYDSQKNLLTKDLKLLEKYKIVNDFLRQKDWLFISPIFFQGYELDYFFKLSSQGCNDKSKITKLIFRKFFDLKWTASFIEGYCKRCSHIKPFLKSIEHSLILTFQRDYEGGIKTLIPIIEGILRNYLNSEKNLSRINFKELRKSFTSLKEDLICGYKKGLSNYTNQNKIEVFFSKEQIAELVKLQTEYYNIWFSFVIEFVDKSFYLNTEGRTITNELNRHAILHEFGLNIPYNLENYIKVYFVLQFLTWIFLRKEDKSTLNQIKEFRFLEKIIAYRNIIKYSDKIAYDKHLLLKDYEGYNSNLLRDKYEINVGKLLPNWMMIKYKILKYLWKERPK